MLVFYGDRPPKSYLKNREVNGPGPYSTGIVSSFFLYFIILILLYVLCMLFEKDIKYDWRSIKSNWLLKWRFFQLKV